MALETIDVEYIGKKERKRDTVNQTGVEWFGEGDVQPYPSNLASKLLAHSKVWKRADGKSANAATLPAAHNPDSGDEIVKTPADTGFGSSDEVNSIVEPENIQSLTIDQEVTSTNEASPEINTDNIVDRAGQVKSALSQLKPEDFNGQNYPIIARVREITGIKDLASKEVNKIFQDSQPK